jgi:hypothetical protein
MSSPNSTRKPLGVRATPEQHRLLTEAAAREHRSVSNFVLQAALEAAEKYVPSPPKFTEEETLERIRHAQALFRQSNLYERDLVAELIAERRAEAQRE